MAQMMKEYHDIEFVLTNHRCPEEINLPERHITYDLYRGIKDIPFPNLNLDYDDAYYKNIRLWKKVALHVLDLISINRFRDGDHKLTLMTGPNSCTLDYVNNHLDKKPHMIRPELIFKPYRSTHYDSKYEKKFQELAERLRRYTAYLFKETAGPEMPAEISNKFKQMVFKLFLRIESDLEQAREYARELPSEVELLTGTAKHYVRVMSEAIREHGCQVTGFPHEGGLCGLVLPILSLTEFATCDRFVCFDERDADDYRRYSMINTVQFPVERELGQSILNIDVSKLTSSFSFDLKKISNIMYVNSSYWYEKYGYEIYSDTQGFDLQLRILDFLLSLGKSIIFKNRPKTALLNRRYDHFGYFRGRVEYKDTPFTQVLDDADLFVFEVVGSTALYEAMTLTEKPILLFKPPLPKCTHEFDSILRKRCFVVEMYEDDKNRLVFNQEKLKGIFNL
ncbi:hypothetical protein ACFL9T_09185 [Thermodesulfobacteriota bacterium]